MVKIQNYGHVGPGMVNAKELMMSDIVDYGEKTEPFIVETKYIFLLRKEFYIFSDKIKEVDDKHSKIIGYKRFSAFTKKESMAWIDMLINRLGEMDIPKDLQPEALAKWAGFQDLANKSGWKRFEGEEVTQKEYKEAVINCEMCGKPINGDGSLAHIMAVGMGGNQEDWKELPENWFHLHDKCHAYLDNGPGIKKVMEEFPHLKAKIENAKTLGVKIEV